MYESTSMIMSYFEPHRDKTNKMACAPSEDSDQPGHLPSLIRVFAVCMKTAWVLGYPLSTQRRLIRLGGCPGWSVFAGQTCYFVGFVTMWLILYFQTPNMDKVHNVLRNPSKMSQLVTNDNLPSFVQDKMARTYASWLQWWKSTITSDDYMKYLSTQVIS